MISNETIKKRIREGLAEKEIEVGKIQLSGIEINGNIKYIKQVKISMELLDGVQLDELKSTMYDIADANGFDITGVLIEF